MATRKSKKDSEVTTTSDSAATEGSTSGNEPTTRAVEDIPEEEGYLGAYGNANTRTDQRTDPGVDNEPSK